MKIKRVFVNIIIFCLFFLSVVAEAGFNNTGLGARSLSMGRASTALSDEVETVYWNPAGLAKLETGLSFSHANLYSLSSTNLDSFSMIQPNIFFDGVFGLYYLKEDDVMTNPLDNKITKSNLEETSIGFCMAKEVLLKNDNYPFSLSVGASLKLLRTERIEIKNEINRGAALDIGILCKPKNTTRLKDFRLGIDIKNIATTKVGTITPTKSFDLGFAFALAENKKILKINLDKLLSSIDIDKNNGDSLKLHLGIETVINKNLFVRFGSDDKNLTCGLGYNIGNWRLDYGIGLYDNGNTHYFTVSNK